MINFMKMSYKNRISLFVIAALFLVTSKGYAGEPPSQVNDVAYVTWWSQKPAPGNINCEIKFSELDYVGLSFAGKAVCIAAKSDAAARNGCPIDAGWSIINPANPQYTKRSPHPDGTSSSVARTTNPNNYYYCVPPDPRNNKSNACRNIAPTESTYLQSDNNLEFKWTGGDNTKKDGDCLCGQKGYPGTLRDCSQSLPTFPDRCQPIGLKTATYDEISAMTDATAKDQALCSIACKCNDGRIFPVGAAEAKCKEPSTPQPVKVSGTVDRPPVEDNLDANLKVCVDAWKEKANKCKEASAEAKKQCGAEDKKTSNNDTSKVIDAASNAYIGNKSGTGAQQECFTGGVVANMAKDLLNRKSEECDSASTSCTTSCNMDELNKEKTRCHNILTTVVQEKYGSEVPENKNSSYFTEGERIANEVVTQGSAVCGEASKADKPMISSALESVGKSMAASLTCMCKLSSGGTGPCNQIVPPSGCATNPSLPGCRQYSAIGVCTPGSGYDAKLCSCQLNPKGAGCPGGDASGGLSNFATGGEIHNSTGTADIGTPVSDLKAGAADLGGTTPDAGTAANLKLEPTKTGTASGGPGGGSGAGSGAGGGDPSGAPPEEDEKSGIGGLFGAAKSFMSNAFSGKKGGKGNGDLAGSKSKIDPNKFRPIRGVASKNGVGSKNQDIWKMVNTCLYSETCASNSNSFLESPLKHK